MPAHPDSAGKFLPVHSGHHDGHIVFGVPAGARIPVGGGELHDGSGRHLGQVHGGHRCHRHGKFWAILAAAHPPIMAGSSGYRGACVPGLPYGSGGRRSQMRLLPSGCVLCATATTSGGVVPGGAGDPREHHTLLRLQPAPASGLLRAAPLHVGNSRTAGTDMFSVPGDRRVGGPNTSGTCPETIFHSSAASAIRYSTVHGAF